METTNSALVFPYTVNVEDLQTASLETIAISVIAFQHLRRAHPATVMKHVVEGQSAFTVTLLLLLEHVQIYYL